MVLVDSSVWIDFFRGRIDPRTDAIRDLRRANRLLIGDLVLVEVLRGITDGADFQNVKMQLSKLPFATLGGSELALKAAENYAALRAKGRTIRNTVDLMVGTFCLEHDLPLLHSDRDFEHFEQHLGLQVYRT